MTVCDVGDPNMDGQVSTFDVAVFVDVLTGLDTTLGHVWGSDLDCDGITDARDIESFIDAILNP